MLSIHEPSASAQGATVGGSAGQRRSLIASLAAAVGGSAEAAIALALLSVVLVVGGTAWILKLQEKPVRPRPAPVAVAPAPEVLEPEVADVAWAEQLDSEVAELEEQQREAQEQARATAPAPVSAPQPRAPASASAPPAAASPTPAPAPMQRRAQPALARAKLDWQSCEQPRYPRESLAKREEGAVIMAFQVDAAGKVIDKRVEKKSGSPLLDRTALNALAKCRFSPATLGGVPQASWTQVRFVWKLGADG